MIALSSRGPLIFLCLHPSPTSFCSIWAPPILSSRPWRLQQRGAQDLSRTARCAARRACLWLIEHRAMLVPCLGVAPGVSYSSSSGVTWQGLASRSMARAMIASAYIRQLRSGLPLCCMHGRIARRYRALTNASVGLVKTVSDLVHGRALSTKDEWKRQQAPGGQAPYWRPRSA
jgi:hypothetical protein